LNIHSLVFLDITFDLHNLDTGISIANAVVAFPILQAVKVNGYSICESHKALPPGAKACGGESIKMQLKNSTKTVPAVIKKKRNTSQTSG